MHITDYDIQSLVDDQADETMAKQIYEAVIREPALYYRYQLYKKQKTLLKTWWKDN